MTDRQPRPRLDVTVTGEDGPITVVMSPVDPEHYDLLVSSYPDPDGLAPFEEDTFGPALIAACLVDPVVDEVITARWWSQWPNDAVEVLFSAALELSAPGSVEWAVNRLRVDDRFAAEMGYCGPAGVAHDVFLTWPRSSQDKAIAWQVTKDDHCPGCGVPSRFMDDETAAEVRSRRCVHCHVLGQVEADVPPDQQREIHSSVVPARTGARA